MPVISSTLWMVASSAIGGLFLVLLLIAGVVVPVRVSSVHRALDARPAAPRSCAPATPSAARAPALQPGLLSSMGLNDRISSVRMVSGARADNEPDTPSRWQRRGDERLFEVPVDSVRAVVATPEQRCWIEPQPVAESAGDSRKVPGAAIGAIIGGVLGHQVGGGTGRDIATAGGAVAGAVAGSRVGSDGRRVATQDVQRCKTVPSTRATDCWDVAHTFRGQQHNLQLSSPPGPTITVNRDGRPRVWIGTAQRPAGQAVRHVPVMSAMRQLLLLWFALASVG